MGGFVLSFILAGACIWCAAIMVVGLMQNAAADDGPGDLGSDGATAGNLSPGYHPRGQGRIPDVLRDGIIHPKEQESIAGFPGASTRRLRRVDGARPVNFLVDAVLQSGEQQLLRGHFVDMRGLPLDGTSYISPLERNWERRVSSNR